MMEIASGPYVPVETMSAPEQAADMKDFRTLKDGFAQACMNETAINNLGAEPLLALGTSSPVSPGPGVTWSFFIVIQSLLLISILD